MTPDLARKYIEDITESAGDPEAAHSLEDESRDRFLHACSSGYYSDTSEAKSVAKILLETDEIDFPRLPRARGDRPIEWTERADAMGLHPADEEYDQQIKTFADEIARR